MMPESEILTRMGIKGMGNCIDAVSDLLISAGYHDAANTLRLRWDECTEFNDDEDSP